MFRRPNPAKPPSRRRSLYSSAPSRVPPSVEVQRVLGEVDVHRAPEGLPPLQDQVGFHPGLRDQQHLEVDSAGQVLTHHIAGGRGEADLSERGRGPDPGAAHRGFEAGGEVDCPCRRPAVPLPSTECPCEGHQVVRGQTRPIQAAAEAPSVEDKLTRQVTQGAGSDVHLFHAIGVVDRPDGSAESQRPQGQGPAFVDHLARPDRKRPARQRGSGDSAGQWGVEAKQAYRQRRPLEMPGPPDTPQQGGLAVKPILERSLRPQGSPELATKPCVRPGKQQIPGEEFQGQHACRPSGGEAEAVGEPAREIHARQAAGQEGSQDGFHPFDPGDLPVQGSGHLLQGGAPQPPLRQEQASDVESAHLQARFPSLQCRARHCVQADRPEVPT